MDDTTYAMADPLRDLLDAWEHLCLSAGAAKGRRCLRAGEALTAGTAADREAVGRALAALGYPQAMGSGARLGGALRALRGRRGGRGRFLSMSHARGGSIWYVTGGGASGA